MARDEAEDLTTERERVAERLRRIRKGVRDRALLERPAQDVLPEPRSTRPPEPAPSEPPAPAQPPLVRPDGTAVNSEWQATPQRELPGWRGRLGRFLSRLLEPSQEAQVAFNSHQVQFDNATLDYIDARFDQTHRHYDDVLGLQGRHLREIDERHMILQEELVAHVHDLVRRIDLVLSEAERGRLGLEFALRDLQERLSRLEERLKRG
jgi:hypothetical protein